jgi:hypothetical protein
LTSAGICFGSAVPIESSRKIPMSHSRGLETRWSDTSNEMRGRDPRCSANRLNRRWPKDRHGPGQVS